MIAQFGEITFEITASDALLFRDLKMQVGCETDDLESNQQKYAGYKNGKQASVSMTALLSAALGSDVRGTILQLQHAAQRGAEEHLTIGQERLYPFKLMLTKADADKILISPLGQWVSAEVSLDFAQSSPEYIYEDETVDPAWTGGDGTNGPEFKAGKLVDMKLKLVSNPIYLLPRFAREGTSGLTKKKSGILSYTGSQLVNPELNGRIVSAGMDAAKK